MDNIHARELVVVHALHGASFPASAFIIPHHIDIATPTRPELPISQDV